MTTIATVEALLYPAALGAGVAYSMYGRSLLPLGVGALGGYFAYKPLMSVGHSLSSLPPVISYAVPEIVAGGLIGYSMYGGDLTYTAAGAAIGVGVKYAMGRLLSAETGVAAPY